MYRENRNVKTRTHKIRIFVFSPPIKGSVEVILRDPEFIKNGMFDTQRYPLSDSSDQEWTGMYV